MKKLFSLLLVFVFLFSFVACSKAKDDFPTTHSTTGKAGETSASDSLGDETVEYETDKKGNLVTDANGDPIVKGDYERDKNGNIVTDAVGNPVVKDNNPKTTDSDVLTEPPTLISDETFPPGDKIEVTIKPDGRPEKSMLETALGNTFKGKKYSFKFTAQMEMEGKTQRVPAAIYVSGKKSLVEMTMGDSLIGLAKIGVLNDGKNKYMLMSFMGLVKGYMKMPDEASGDYDALFDFSDFTDTSDMKYVKTGKVKYKGVDYVYEEYRTEDSTIKFFFAGGKLKRIEQINDDGAKVFMENIEISTSFSESVFNIPPGYKELKEEDLEKLSGLFG